MRKSRFMKLASTALAAVIATTSMSLTAFADHTVVISHDDGAGEVTATSSVSGVSRMALAQFDVYGRMINFAVGAENSATVTNKFNYAPEYKTKVMSFSNFDTATAVEEVRTLGSKTLFLWDGETYSNTNGTYIYNGQSIDPWSQTGKWTGTPAKGTIGTNYVFEYGDEIHCKLNDADSMTDASGNKYSGAWFNLASGKVSSEWVVFEWDMTINTNQATQNDQNVSAFTINMSEGTEESPAFINLANYRFNNNSLEVAYLTGSHNGKSGTQEYTERVGEEPKTGLRYKYLGGYSNVKGYGSANKYHMAVLINYRDEMLEFYVDEALKGTLDWTDSAEEQYLSDGQFTPNAIRFSLSGSKFDVSFDNLRCYEGSERRTDISNELVKEIVIGDEALTTDMFSDRYDDSIYVKKLGSYKTVHANTGVVWNGSKKVILNNTPYESKVEGRGQMVPKDELATALGIPCGSTSDSETKNGVTYVPITSFLSGETYTHLSAAPDNANGYVIGTDTFAPEDVDLFNDWMMYYRPTADTVMADYKTSARYYQHPRLLATSADFDALRDKYEEYLVIDPDVDADTGIWTPALNEPWNRWLRSTIQFADQMVNERWTPQYKAYDSAGRMSWQRRFASEMHAFAMAYQLTGDTKYIDAAWREIEIVCSDEFPDFNLTHRLDTSEAMAAFAIAYDWMYHGFTAEQRAAMEKCMHDKGLYHAWSGYTTNTGMALEFFASYNHAVVGNNGAAMLAMSLLDVYPEASAWVLSEAIKAQDRNIQLWYNEAWPEGVGYWELTMQHTSKFIESLDGIFPGGYGFKGLEGLNRAGVAQAQHHTPLGNFNYSDADESSKYWVPELIWLANTYDDPGLAQLVAENTNTFSTDKNWKGEDVALAVLWYDDSQTEALSTDYINTKIDVATLRDTHASSTDDEYTFVGIKGGTPTDGHAHIDTGSFVFEADGIRWARDLGSGTYTGSNYFDYEKITGNRWLHISARGEAHNTLINNPVSTKGDMNIFTTADLNLVDSNDSGAIVTVDMSKAMFNVSAAKRGFFYTDNRESLVIRDEVTPSAASSMYWTMMLPTNCTITDNGNGSFTITSGEETLLVEYAISGGILGTVTKQSSNFTSIFESSGNILDLTTTSNGQVVRKFSSGKLQLPITASSGANVTITVKLTPGSVSSPSAFATYNKAIANWSL